jgi:hypothetical protein
MIGEMESVSERANLRTQISNLQLQNLNKKQTNTKARNVAALRASHCGRVDGRCSVAGGWRCLARLAGENCLFAQWNPAVFSRH